ncbi:hypothetical protein GN330_11320 [Nitratireductor sp. CAU 1489]|uniref:Uncharacterized protein n=1 Tax=Nitratireductor arenosus TaxID=2682096 RepID=A0A844QGT3_9HYPH|nr:hypothetical protein [Nitratireductor arenosus]MVA97834.1 hypothetical protein [Nitratireductor arenosus]
MKFAYAVLLSLVYVVLLLGLYAVHVRFLPVDVVLYSALQDALAALVVLVAAVVALRRLLPFNSFETMLLVVVWFLGGYAFAISVPTVLDRSLSFYILEKLEQRGGGIRRDAIGRMFAEEYLPEYRLVDVRLTEQVESGTVVIEDGCVKLTSHGARLAAVSRFFRTHLLARKRLLADGYTDALIDPFKNSPKGRIGYECG